MVPCVMKADVPESAKSGDPASIWTGESASFYVLDKSWDSWRCGLHADQRHYLVLGEAILRSGRRSYFTPCIWCGWASKQTDPVLRGASGRILPESNQGLFASANLRKLLIQLTLGETAEDSPEGQAKIQSVKWFWFADWRSQQPTGEDVNKVSFRINRFLMKSFMRNTTVISKCWEALFRPLVLTAGRSGRRTSINEQLSKRPAAYSNGKGWNTAFGDGVNDIDYVWP